MFLKILVLFAAAFSFCCEKGQSYQPCNSSSLFSIAVGDAKSCDLDFPTHPVNDLDKVVSSCFEVHFCSLPLQFQVSRTLSFRDVHTISFIGANITTLDCITNTSIEFTNVTNLKVMNLQFLNCAKRYIAYQSNNNSYPWIGIMIFNCSNILFKNAIVSQSKGIGIAVFNTAGINEFYECVFKSNAGTGLMLEISNYNDTYRNLQDSIYAIKNCKFTGNIAHSGGGMHISFRYASYNNSINISDCYFFNNSVSQHGGALDCFYTDETARNSLMLSHSLFRNNTSHRMGGAYSIYFKSYKSQCRNNSVLVDSCLFQSNEAKFGGGLYFLTTRTYAHIRHTSYNKIEHYNSIWINNSAWYGAAILIVPISWSQLAMGALLTPEFENCTLRSNRVLVHFFNGKNSLQMPFRQNTLGGGALYCSQHDVIFKGTLVVEYNNGSGILGNSCTFTFHKGLTATFNGNTGYVGGAFQLVGYSTLYLSEGNMFSFYNNSAETDGGAIYHQTSDIIEHDRSDSCFISGIKKDTDVKFNFVGNLAGAGNGERGHGNSIYTVSLQSCSNVSISKIANTTKINEVVTRVSSFSTQHSNSSLVNLPIIPGKYTQLDFKGYDDLYHERSALYRVTVQNHNNSQVIPHELSSFATNKSIKLLGNPGDIATVYLSTLSKQKTVLSLTVELEPCPPGYVLLILENYSKGCVCSSDTDTPYTGIDCDFLHFSAKLIRGFWAGYDESISIKNDFSFITAYCPNGYCQYTSYQLPKHASREILNSNVCERNREGLLCSRCKKNTSHYFHSPTNMCGRQDLCYLGLLFYFASEIVPVTVIFLCIIAINLVVVLSLISVTCVYARWKSGL